MVRYGEGEGKSHSLHWGLGGWAWVRVTDPALEALQRETLPKESPPLWECTLEVSDYSPPMSKQIWSDSKLLIWTTETMKPTHFDIETSMLLTRLMKPTQFDIQILCLVTRPNTPNQIWYEAYGFIQKTYKTKEPYKTVVLQCSTSMLL